MENRVVESCPVCHEPLGEDAKHCPKCGFPLALADRLDGPVSLSAPPDGGRLDRRSPSLEVARERVVGPEAEMNAAIARGLEERMELLRSIDRDAPDATGALCEAALSEASGRPTDAQQVLRTAQEHMESETEELLARHLTSLEARGQALQASGLRLALDSDLERLADDIVGAGAAASVAALLTSERRLDRVETHWRGLQTLFAQVAALKQEAQELGLDLSGLPDRVDAVRSNLSTMSVTEHDLDVAAQAAAETLMRLHEAIPPVIEAELARHAERLGDQSRRSPRLPTARRIHGEAVQHLKAGRLEDATHSVRELRKVIDALVDEAEEVPPEPEPVVAPAPVPAPEPAAPPRPSAPEPLSAPATAPARSAVDVAPATASPAPVPTPAPTPVPAGEEMVAALAKKARALAGRIRALPADSEQARSAARQIHEATELLRARRYEEADAALTRLMRSLTGGGP